MVRPVAQGDLPQILDLLRWMDRDPARRVLVPDARVLEELFWEVEGGWVLANGARLEGYAALYPFWEGGALEGPLVRGAGGEALVEALVREAERRGYRVLYAFPAEANAPTRALLERCGFSALHTTYFFVTGPRELGFAPPEGVRLEHVRAVDPEVYRALYRQCEDGWSLRLSWSDAELLAHFAREDVALWIAYRDQHPVGMVELEVAPQEAEVAYIGVVPEARGSGIGRALLACAARHAFAQAGVTALRVRAHDHEKSAIELYERLGFTLEEAVVTYARELEAR
ncbi:GNAT family N-acetyltransferase [Marinithermus hydrothermalis]|uniref:GCN5-related N-acetyltransferase n=1 Tax=Marinithermus hydrothermalis (strain DSM 14884 / JCM 11576 / T1) TaxID=869210 RepID=F2NKY3_MARHT|nr:GNAT family N-acetyltransferase [Marinithermus hydrothermalis]AEB11172.1 GCN5-related N-acetyltransferase [Marinithermus hydrothermalis DSM 14884]